MTCPCADKSEWQVFEAISREHLARGRKLLREMLRDYARKHGLIEGYAMNCQAADEALVPS